MIEPKSLIERAEEDANKRYLTAEVLSNMRKPLSDNNEGRTVSILRELVARIRELEELAATSDQRRLQSLAVWQKLCDERNSEISRLTGVIEDVKKLCETKFHRHGIMSYGKILDIINKGEK